MEYKPGSMPIRAWRYLRLKRFKMYQKRLFHAISEVGRNPDKYIMRFDKEAEDRRDREMRQQRAECEHNSMLIHYFNNLTAAIYKELNIDTDGK